ncbi:MAG: Ppx/GppA phosphatase family protein [bacterium]
MRTAALRAVAGEPARALAVAPEPVARRGVRVAAIDVGSNSIHMVVAQVESDGRFRVLDRAKEMVRLGSRTLIDGALSAEAMEKGLRTLASFQMLAERQGVQRIRAVATSAVREASNGGDFVRRVEEEVGLRVKVIPGREEARLIFLGVRHAIDLRGEPTVIVDAGGGSVELILVDGGEAVELVSLKIGLARVSERFLAKEKVDAHAVEALESHLASELDDVLARFRARGAKRVIGTSGTLNNLVAMAAASGGGEPPEHLEGLAVSPESIRRLRRKLAKGDRARRLAVPGLDPKRVDLVVAGAVLADHVLTRLGARELVACTYALREGVLLDHIARHRRGIEEQEQFPDPRYRSVARLIRHLGEPNRHGQQVAKLSIRLFDQLRDSLGLSGATRDWLELAALMHDIGQHISRKNHHRHSYYLITNGELLGFRRDEIEIIAQIARYHRKQVPKPSDGSYGMLSKRERQIVRALAALLRVADGLDRSHYGVVRDVTVARRDRRVVLELTTGGDDAALEIGEARNRVALLEELLGEVVTFRVAS